MVCLRQLAQNFSTRRWRHLSSGEFANVSVSVSCACLCVDRILAGSGRERAEEDLEIGLRSMRFLTDVHRGATSPRIPRPFSEVPGVRPTTLSKS